MNPKQIANIKAALEDILRLLDTLIYDYRPTWHYQVGKVGYECNLCQSLIPPGETFAQPDLHEPNCALIQAIQVLDARAKAKHKPSLVPADVDDQQ